MIGSASLLPAHFNPGIHSQKKDRAAIAGGPSQGRKRPGEGSDSGDYRLSDFANQKARRIDGAQFLLALLRSRVTSRMADAQYSCRSRRLRIMPVGLTTTLAPFFRQECFSNPDQTDLVFSPPGLQRRRLS
jgi:hypothetical protein